MNGNENPIKTNAALNQVPSPSKVVSLWTTVVLSSSLAIALVVAVGMNASKARELAETKTVTAEIQATLNKITKFDSDKDAMIFKLKQDAENARRAQKLAEVDGGHEKQKAREAHIKSRTYQQIFEEIHKEIREKEYIINDLRKEQAKVWEMYHIASKRNIILEAGGPYLTEEGQKAVAEALAKEGVKVLPATRNK